MSLYKDSKTDFLKNKKTIFIAIGVFILVILIYYLITIIDLSSNKEPINIDFTNNPLRLDKAENTEIEINVYNKTNFDQENIEILIEPIEDIFEVKCLNNTNRINIPILAKGNNRKILCSILPKENIPRINILEGTYSFDVKYKIGSVINSKRTILKVKK